VKANRVCLKGQEKVFFRSLFSRAIHIQKTPGFSPCALYPLIDPQLDLSNNVSGSGRVPHVRQSVYGSKKMGRSPFNTFASWAKRCNMGEQTDE
jgi:hypothetical protein